MLTSLDSDFVCMPVWGGGTHSHCCLFQLTHPPAPHLPGNSPTETGMEVSEHRQKCALSNNPKALCRQNSLNPPLLVVSQNYEHGQCAAWLHVCRRQKSDSVFVLCSLPRNLVNRPFSQSLGQGPFWNVGFPVHQRGREGKKWCGAMEP